MTALGTWLDERIGWRKVWEAIFLRKVPKVNWLYTLGSATLFVAVNQIVTGILLTVYYVPTPDHAYNSVQYITTEVTAGWLIRGLHHWGASAMVVLAVLHMLRVIVYGAYKFPREVTWLTGVGLLLVVLGFGFTGYLLPWDQKAFWATTVGTRIAGVAPGVGDFMLARHPRRARTLGGHPGPFLRRPRVDAPGGPAGAAAGSPVPGDPHRHQPDSRTGGVADESRDQAAHPGGLSTRQGEGRVAFFPDVVFKDVVVSLVVFLVLIALAYFVGAPLEERANPADTNYTPRPEWYFLFLFQLLKYFPGDLEVIGVFVLPTLAVVALFLLPWIDRSPRRHLLRRPWIGAVTAAGVFGVGLLTVLSVVEAPPPQAAVSGDPTAALYSANCAGCHGPQISVASGANLHEIIAQGRHEGMPAWSADLTTDQIDALAGFILSPAGSQLFFDNCGACHQAPDVVAGDPLELRRMLEQGRDYPAHAQAEIPDWGEAITTEGRTALLNFLAAPDGQRLFATDCAPCHGRAVSFAGEEAELRQIIAQGGLHLEMPPWREQLIPGELEILAQYVVDPEAATQGATLFGSYCSSCHGQRVPTASSLDQARQIIAGGGAHQTMPVWGEVLTPEQLDALTRYTLEAARGAPQEVGGDLYAQNCAVCHGDFGEGGLNPARADDIIAPISTSEYLKTRDDATLRAIIAQGQPNFGMSPFGTAYGGPLDEDEVDAVVAFLRAWEANPPVELPPEVTVPSASISAGQVYADVCQQCHGPTGHGGVGPSFRTETFRSQSDQDIFDTINLGHEATAMIGWGDLLSAEQIRDLVNFLRTLGAPTTTSAGPASFSRDIVPVLQASCTSCHGSLGGWDGTTYDGVINSGASGPAVVPGDADGSLLVQKLLGTHARGAIMPPSGALPRDQIQLVIDWVAAGAPDN